MGSEFDKIQTVELADVIVFVVVVAKTFGTATTQAGARQKFNGAI